MILLGRFTLRHRLSLRARLTLATTTMAAIGLFAGGALMSAAVERALQGSLDDSARGHGNDIAALVDTGQLTNPLPSFGAAVAQVVDADGNVRASTPGGDRLIPIVDADGLAAIRDGEAVELDGGRLGQTDPLRVVGVPTGPRDDPQIVVIAVSLTELRRSVTITKIAVTVAGAILTCGLAAASWIGIGRTLRPVEQLRRGAEEITGTGGARRLPLPSGDDELTHLAATLNTMLARLDAASERQRTFVADAAHELRSPLTALRTELEVALLHRESVDPYDTAADALTEVKRLARLVDDLLVLAHLDDTTPARDAEDIDLQELLTQVVEAIPAPRVPIVVEDAPPTWTRGHRDALTRVARNLVDNAVRHAATAVVVAGRPVGRHILMTVTDDGGGVPESERQRIFHRFTRLDEARGRDEGGTGLGLAIVWEIVAAHQGSVWVEDAGPGAQFTVQLPALVRCG